MIRKAKLSREQKPVATRLRSSPAGEINQTMAPRESAAPKCPRCGNDMVKRIAKQGPNAGEPFWGCSAFPQCRGIRAAE
jgi:restriction system protein